MDPRMSARRTAVIREQGRRRLRIVVIGLAGSAVLVVAWFLLHTPLFGARSVTVTGNAHESAAQVIDQAGLASQPPLLDVDAGATAARIEQLPWVRAASVGVSWPDGVHIRITEETPRFAVSESGGHWATVSTAGWVQLSMTTPIAVDIGTATQLTAKYEDVSSILAGATLHNGDVIDVSVPDAPTVTGP